MPQKKQEFLDEMTYHLDDDSSDEDDSDDENNDTEEVVESSNTTENYILDSEDEL